MEETNKQIRREDDHDLDRLLDGALSNYAAVEPRAGLEERVLANLHAGREAGRAYSWWRWGLAVAAVVAIAVGFALRVGKRPQPLVKNPTPLTAPRVEHRQVARQNPEAAPLRGTRSAHRAARHSAKPAVVAAAYPKLDQFPSPQPLSEQERLLAIYIDEFPQRAALMAEARMEVLRKDQEEKQKMMSDDGGDTPEQDSNFR